MERSSKSIIGWESKPTHIVKSILNSPSPVKLATYWRILALKLKIYVRFIPTMKLGPVGDSPD